jgi:hypothetical protein
LAAERARPYSRSRPAELLRDLKWKQVRFGRDGRHAKRSDPRDSQRPPQLAALFLCRRAKVSCRPTATDIGGKRISAFKRTAEVTGARSK